MTEDRKQPRPILHRAGSAGHGASHGVVWNEQNLEENERIKATLNPVKINEPKTPYHELLPEDDVDVEPLSLEGAPAPRAGTCPCVPLGALGCCLRACQQFRRTWEGEVSTGRTARTHWRASGREAGSSELRRARGAGGMDGTVGRVLGGMSDACEGRGEGGPGKGESACGRAGAGRRSVKEDVRLPDRSARSPGRAPRGLRLVGRSHGKSRMHTCRYARTPAVLHGRQAQPHVLNQDASKQTCMRSLDACLASRHGLSRAPVHAANGNGHAPQGNGDGDAQSANGNGNPDAGHRRFEALRKAHYGAAGAALKAHLSEVRPTLSSQPHRHRRSLATMVQLGTMCSRSPPCAPPHHHVHKRGTIRPTSAPTQACPSLPLLAACPVHCAKQHPTRHVSHSNTHTEHVAVYTKNCMCGCRCQAPALRQPCQPHVVESPSQAASSSRLALLPAVGRWAMAQEIGVDLLPLSSA
eukprot:365994-Chlamydomonas_euryale.AAC.4